MALTNIHKISVAIIYKLNTERSASVLTNWFLASFPNIESVFDIGCGDGIVATQLPASIRYSGLDIGADIYPRSARPEIAYVENLALLEKKALEISNVDAVFLLDVLEHTPYFTTLFEIGLEKANRFVLVALPNESNLRIAVGLLRDQLPGAHGVRMLGHKLGHRHQWLISVNDALQVLQEVSRAKGFEVKIIAHIANESPNILKRWAFRVATCLLPWRLRSDQFALVFERTGADIRSELEQALPAL